MRFEFDSSKVLYAVGIVFGVAALAYFARDLVFDLSLTVKALLFLFGFLALFAAASAVRRAGLDAVLYVLSAAAYVAFVAYTLGRFDFGDTGVFVALAASSALFVALGYLHRERGLRIEAGTARTVVAAVVVVAVVLVAVDLAVGGVVYSAAVADEAAVDDRDGVMLGTVTAENRFVFRETTDFPRATACVYAPDRQDRPVELRSGADYWGTPDSVGGGGSAEVELWTWLGEEERAAVGNGTIPVERADSCPPESSVSEPRIVVVFEDAVGE
ncbi:hypothetical protein [Halostella litorea]|uniref:hypothetical protein n=1 Tax=Halostella litorea TaxID=2528831 RepID=UPI00109335B4|nr:hypothetical protein [Halostella litorea]